MRAFDGTILCVSHDRYFLDKTVERLIVLRPPGLVDFEGSFSAYAAKLVEETTRAAAETKARNAKPAGKSGSSNKQPQNAKPSQPAKPANAKKADNPWSRTFGRLSVQELEQQISETEIALSQCQGNFGETEKFKDPARVQKLHADYQTLSKH